MAWLKVWLRGGAELRLQGSREGLKQVMDRVHRPEGQTVKVALNNELYLLRVDDISAMMLAELPGGAERGSE